MIRKRMKRNIVASRTLKNCFSLKQYLIITRRQTGGGYGLSWQLGDLLLSPCASYAILNAKNTKQKVIDIPTINVSAILPMKATTNFHVIFCMFVNQERDKRNKIC